MVKTKVIKKEKKSAINSAKQEGVAQKKQK